MALDPLSALSLASNVVQFVDFGSRLVRDAREIYSSVSGATAKQEEARLLAEQFHQQCSRLAALRPLSSESGVSTENKALRTLAERCQITAKETVDLLQDLKVGGTSKRMQSIRQAFRGSIKATKIDELAERMASLRGALNSVLLELLTDQQSMLYSSLTMIAEENRRLEINRKNDLLDLKKDVIRSIHTLRPGRPEMMDLAMKLQELGDQAQRAEQEQRIIDSLVFKSMNLRYSRISGTHADTFKWIFDDKNGSSAKIIPFKEWLQNGTGIFWVAGKAGSGKSTLMKYLHDHQQVGQLLQAWTEGKRLMTAGFFFWNAGHELQRTQEGLLQSMLFEVLRQSPVLVEKSCPKRWHSKHLFDIAEPWTRDELVQAFRNMVTLSAVDTKFCFFVDGLDEYTGDHRELVELLKTVFDSSVIKLCVSSRPWNIFQEGFGQLQARQLLLEELTRDYITTYVRDLLENNQSFRALKQRDHRCQELVNEITGKAQGVEDNIDHYSTDRSGL